MSSTPSAESFNQYSFSRRLPYVAAQLARLLISHREGFREGPELRIAARHRMLWLRLFGFNVAAGNLHYFIFAHDQDQVMVACREGIVARQPDNTLRATGVLSVRDKGHGLAIPIELAHKHVLQLIADANGNALTYAARNENDLQRIRYLARANPDPTVSIEMAREQARWKNVYYKKLGMLATAAGGEFYFEPRNPTVASGQYPVTFGSTDLIYLERVDQADGRATASVLYQETSPHPMAPNDVQHLIRGIERLDLAWGDPPVW